VVKGKRRWRKDENESDEGKSQCFFLFFWGSPSIFVLNR
jgi:hypothetical protein